MQVININSHQTRPIFTSRKRVKQDNNIKLYKGQVPPIYGNLSAGKSLLLQRFDYHEINNDGVDVKDRTYDSFTGLRDKNYLFAALSAKMREAQRNNKTLSIAMFDMDDFKSVNELLGYEVGDIFIKKISKNISEIANEHGVEAYRFGGEEFVIIFDNQSDNEKKQIAKDITRKINSDDIIQSYKGEYIKNAQVRLDRSFYATAKMRRISELQIRRETLREVIENVMTLEAKNDPYLKDAMKEVDLQTAAVYRNLINECLSQEKDENSIIMLTQMCAKLMSGEKLLKSEKRDLDEYLAYIYNKTSEIFQTKKWMRDFQRNDGFGITCGVVNLAPNSFKNKNPMYIIEKASKVLKKGKNDGKGQVYF